MSKCIVCLIFLLLTSLAGPVYAPASFPENHAHAVIAIPLNSPVQIDGRLEETCWQNQACTGFIQSDPNDGEPASEKTMVWIGYDKTSLYVAARLCDSSPEGIVSRLGRRDDKLDSDWFVFAVDPYYDRRSGFQFSINPAGSIMDSTLYNDEGIDPTWDGVWESAARIDDTGWTVEMRIPYHQLRFKPKNDYTWGVNFFRAIHRKNEKDMYAWKPKEESGYVSRFAPLTGIRGIRPGRLIELKPFSVGKAGFLRHAEGDPFNTGREFTGNAGFDFMAGLQSNLTLNLTVNPDFGQVEVDPAVINISDQETYYQEKRPFFIEGADIFRFGYGGTNQVRNLGWSNPNFFYSRRIGRAPQGYPATSGFADVPEWSTILGAAKITGKIGNGWNLGFMEALTQREFASISEDGLRSQQEIEPFTHYGVLRAQKEFQGGQQGVGFIATSVIRDLHDSPMQFSLTGSAHSLALDGWTFLDRDRTWVVTGWMGGTRVTGTQAAMTRLQKSFLHYFQRPDAGHVDVDENATALNGWAGRVYVNKQKGRLVFNTGFGAVSPGFNAMDMGYHSRGDTINAHIETGYQTFHPGKVFRDWKITLSTYRNYNFTGHKTDEYYNFNASARFLNYWGARFYVSYDPSRYNHRLTRGGPMSLYPWGFTRRISFSSDNRKPVVMSLFAHYRTHPYGAYNYSFGGGILWKARSNFSLSIGPSYTWRHSCGQWITRVQDPLKTETYGTRYIFSDIIQETLPVEIRINWTFTPRLSLQAYLQPFLGAGNFFRFKELKAARTFDFLFFGEDGISTIAKEGSLYTVDPDGPGPADSFSFRDPDFNLKSMRGTVVLRWEYSPGSTIYAVWTQNRWDTSHPGNFDLGRDLADLLQAGGDHVFLFKMNYRFTF
jgi:hypothetical protein